jgi:hypothetical protein
MKVPPLIIGSSKLGGACPTRRKSKRYVSAVSICARWSVRGEVWKEPSVAHRMRGGDAVVSVQVSDPGSRLASGLAF